MQGTFKVMVAAAGFAAMASLASAAPVTQLGDTGLEVDTGILKVHGDHRSCRRDRRGWHRHNEWGERRRCRTWSGRGRRPDFCVQVGPLWYCDY